MGAQQTWSSDALTDAGTLLLAVTTTEFLSALVITNSQLAYLKGLTYSLQAEDKYLIEAANEINTIKATSSKSEKILVFTIESKFTTVERMCSSMGTAPSMSRGRVQQSHHSNTPCDNPS